MLLRAYHALAAAAVFLAPAVAATPAAAADILVPGGPPGIAYLCAPPPAALATVQLEPNIQGWWKRGEEAQAEWHRRPRQRCARHLAVVRRKR